MHIATCNMHIAKKLLNIDILLNPSDFDPGLSAVLKRSSKVNELAYLRLQVLALLNDCDPKWKL